MYIYIYIYQLCVCIYIYIYVYIYIYIYPKVRESKSWDTDKLGRPRLPAEHIADRYFNVEITIRNTLQALRFVFQR